MTTHTIVDKDTDPLGPGEINAGVTVAVSQGDVFVIAASANAKITFVAAGGGPADFDMVFAGSNANGFDIKVESGLSVGVSIPDGADLGQVNLDAKAASSVTMNAGDTVRFGAYDGSDSGPNSIVLRAGFTTTKDWKLGQADDALSVGDDVVANSLKTSHGDDSVYLGANASAGAVDGGDGQDSFTSETPGAGHKNMETVNFVCFAAGTMIDVRGGRSAVERLAVGMAVRTMDHGLHPVRWIGARSIDGRTLAGQDHLHPVRIDAGALGPGVPAAHVRGARGAGARDPAHGAARCWAGLPGGRRGLLPSSVRPARGGLSERGGERKPLSRGAGGKDAGGGPVGRGARTGACGRPPGARAARPR